MAWLLARRAWGFKSLDRLALAGLQQAIKYSREVLIVMYVAEVRIWGIRQRCRRKILRDGKVVLVGLSI